MILEGKLLAKIKRLLACGLSQKKLLRQSLISVYTENDEI